MREFLRIVGVAVLLLLRCIASASSAPLDAAAATIAFAPPQGHCVLDAREELDGRFVQTMGRALGPEVRILAAFADCTQLSVWRKGLANYIRDYGFLTTLREDEGQNLAAPRAVVVRAIARELRRADAGAAVADVKARTDSVSTARLAETAPLGVLHSDEDAVYYGLVGRVVTADGRAVDALEIGAMTLIKGKVVSYLLYGEYRGRASVDTMLAAQRRNVDALIDAN